MTRVLPLCIAIAVGVVLAGCQGSISMPVPTGTSSPSPSGGGISLPGEDDLVTPTGSSVIGNLGDPCALLKKSEIQKALGVAVLAVVRGEVKADGSQICAWAMDAPGSTAAALGGFVGTLPSSPLGDVVNGMGTAAAVFGVVLQQADQSAGGEDDGGSSDTPPGVTITKVSIGGGGAVIATPNGGAAFAYDGIRTNLMLMDLIAGPSSTDALQSLLTKAYDRL